MKKGEEIGTKFKTLDILYEIIRLQTLLVWQLQEMNKSIVAIAIKFRCCKTIILCT